MEQFWFVVPLRGRAASGNWALVERDVRRTLRSILSQDDTNIRIILSCEDVPELGFDDPRLILIARKYPAPASFLEMAMDKRAKKRAALAHVASSGGGYVMLVDADDLVHRSLVSFVRQHNNKRGYVISDGYAFYLSTNTIQRVPQRFDAKCGSSYIMHFSPDELPQTADDETSFAEQFGNHRLAAQMAAAKGRPLWRVPFPAAVYVLETGENLSNIHPNNVRFSRFTIARKFKALIRAMGGRRKISDEFREVYGMPHPNLVPAGR